MFIVSDAWSAVTHGFWQTPRAMFIIELTYKVDLAAIDVCAKTLRGGDVRASQHATGLDALFATEVAKTR